MGHFGRRPIARAWALLVCPALILNYLGQGALVLVDPSARENPFFHLAPDWLLYPLVALSTAATVIASQALISGAFSLTRQAMLLGYLPRVTIKHTAYHTEGQIYIPEVNNLLAIGCLALVLTFRESVRLAAAYGIAVSISLVVLGWHFASDVLGGMLLSSGFFFLALALTRVAPGRRAGVAARRVRLALSPGLGAAAAAGLAAAGLIALSRADELLAFARLHTVATVTALAVMAVSAGLVASATLISDP